ncbi:MAG: hypothetical protein V4494_03575 [Chlamydiota bacterium]
MSKKVIKIFFFIIAFTSLERFCHKQTEGFQIHKILSNLSFDPKWGTPPLEKELEIALDQSYSFLGSGGQCYAFLSEDKQYVIKFFKQHHMRKIPYLEKIVLPSFLNRYRNKILLDRAKRSQERIFGSYKIAHDHLKKETALLYLHLNKTTYFNKSLKIIDKLGISHEIDIDTLEFSLQKTAVLAYPHLKSLIRQKNIPELKQCIRSLCGLIATRFKLGITDEDPAYEKNFGFINNIAVEIDLGSFTWASDAGNLQILQQETHDFKNWLAKRCPELVDYFNEQLDEALRYN